VRIEPRRKKVTAFVDTVSVIISREKGIDLRMALDIVRLARTRTYDVALLFTQDQDFSEVAREVRSISLEQDRWIKVACAFPVSPTSRNRRGIDGSDWIRIPRDLYDACLDRRDPRPAGPS